MKIMTAIYVRWFMGQMSDALLNLILRRTFRDSRNSFIHSISISHSVPYTNVNRTDVVIWNNFILLAAKNSRECKNKTTQILHMNTHVHVCITTSSNTFFFFFKKSHLFVKIDSFVLMVFPVVKVKAYWMHPC